MMLIVRLLAAMPVANNRIAFTDRTKAYDDLVAVVGPAGSKLPQPGRYWDKEDRYLKGASPSDVDPPRSQPAAKLLLLKKISTEREYSFLLAASITWLSLLAGYLPVCAK